MPHFIRVCVCVFLQERKKIINYKNEEKNNTFMRLTDSQFQRMQQKKNAYGRTGWPVVLLLILHICRFGLNIDRHQQQDTLGKRALWISASLSLPHTQTIS